MRCACCALLCLRCDHSAAPASAGAHRWRRSGALWSRCACCAVHAAPCAVLCNSVTPSVLLPLLPACRDEFEVVAIDMRGYNESSAPKVTFHPAIRLQATKFCDC